MANVNNTVWQKLTSKFLRSPRTATLAERRRLLKTLDEFWIRGVLQQSPLRYNAKRGIDAQNNDVIPRCDLIAQHARARPTALAARTPIISLWDEFKQTLLILGAPGAGKTSLLLELTQQLLSIAQQDSAKPMPVIFDLSAWQERQPTSLVDWLILELHSLYDVPDELASHWLDTGAVLPLLDSFDEVPPELQEHCLQAIENWRGQHAHNSMALCAQAGDYAALTTRLQLPGAVFMQPLTRQQISRCLVQLGESAAAVHTAWYQNQELWELLQNPLMLNLAAAGMHTEDDSTLQMTGPITERQSQLWQRCLRDRLPDTIVDAPCSVSNIANQLSHIAQWLQCHQQSWFQATDITWQKQRATKKQLDYAAQRGLLIKMGRNYRFIHSLLQDYLAARASTEESLHNESKLLVGSGLEIYTRGGALEPTSEPLLSVDNLTVNFGEFSVVQNLSFTLQRGETLGVVGESGSGKSLTALSLLRLVPATAALTGHIRFAEHDMLVLPERDLEDLRGRRIAMIFQEPMTALNPVLSVGEQIAEMFILHERVSGKEAWERAIAALGRVHIPDPAQRAGDYPHQLSGGMRQRVMIAMALACRPDLLIADEPTTALDVTVQAHILDLILELQEELGMAVLFISHNLGVVSQVADRVLVMYAGKALETAPTEQLLRNPEHPYTRALLTTLPSLGARRGPLPTIAGTVPSANRQVAACVFAERCALVDDRCQRIAPALRERGAEHWVACLKTGA